MDLLTDVINIALEATVRIGTNIQREDIAAQGGQSRRPLKGNVKFK